MSGIRLIPRLDIKGKNLIKSVHLEGLRVIGDPREIASAYYQAGADELIYMDVVASLYERNSLKDIVEHTTRDIFVPITVGGGVRKVQDAKDLLRAGADKIAVNTAAVARPEFITEMAHTFGSQCMVLSIEGKRNQSGTGWEAYTDNGRERTGLDAVEWARRGAELGAGEVLITSIDREGTARGFDLELVSAISRAVRVPVIASGGMGTMAHLVDVVGQARPDAVAMAHVLHYGHMSLPEIRRGAAEAGLNVREVPQ